MCLQSRPSYQCTGQVQVWVGREPIQSRETSYRTWVLVWEATRKTHFVSSSNICTLPSSNKIWALSNECANDFARKEVCRGGISLRKNQPKSMFALRTVIHNTYFVFQYRSNSFSRHRNAWKMCSKNWWSLMCFELIGRRFRIEASVPLFV